MNEEIVFYHNPMSRGRMVHWMLEEIGAPYRFELLRFDQGENKKPAFLAVNPMGKLPTYVGLLSQRPAYKRFNEQSDKLAAQLKPQSTSA